MNTTRMYCRALGDRARRTPCLEVDNRTRSSITLPEGAVMRQQHGIGSHVLSHQPQAEIDVGTGAFGKMTLEPFTDIDGARANFYFRCAAGRQDDAVVDNRGKARRIFERAEMSQAPEGGGSPQMPSIGRSPPS